MNKINCDKNSELVECINPVQKTYRVRWHFESEINEVEYNVLDEDNNPIVIKNEVTSWTCVEEEFKHKPTIDDIKRLIIDFYNKECDKEIVSGLTYEGSEVWLSQENQFNYKSAFDFAVQTQGANLPVKFKFGTDKTPVYVDFTSIEKLRDFIIKVMTHINTTLNKYWVIKDQIDWSKYE